MDNKKVIGILGGMGAAASANFYSTLVELCQTNYNAINDDDFPGIWLYNLPIKDFDETGFVDLESVKMQLIDSVKKIENTKSDFIVIPCNTVHYFVDNMREAISIPIISIIDVTIEAIRNSGYNKIGILSSASTRKYLLYENESSKQGIETISTSDEEQLDIDSAIGNVISGKQSENDINKIKVIVNRFVRDGAEAVILGCTELPLAFSQKDCEIPVFNTITLLAEAALKFSYNK